jgi:hypothetical protein
VKKEARKLIGKRIPEFSEPSAYELVQTAVGLSAQSEFYNLAHHTEELLREGLALWFMAPKVLKKWCNNPAALLPSDFRDWYLPPPEPSIHELVRLAVALSTRREFYNLGEPKDTEDLLRQALTLWHRGHKMLENWRDNPVAVIPAFFEEHLPSRAIPTPKKYPVSLDKFLSIVLPTLSGRSAEKYGLFREYLRFRLKNPLRPPKILSPSEVSRRGLPPFDCCSPRIVPGVRPLFSSEPVSEPTKDDVDEKFALWRREPIPDKLSYEFHFRAFRSWYKQRTRRFRKAAARPQFKGD